MGDERGRAPAHPLIVLTVHPVAMSAWTQTPISYPQDQADETRARAAAQEGADKAAARSGSARPR